VGHPAVAASRFDRGKALPSPAIYRQFHAVGVKSFDREVLGKLCQFLQIKPGDLLVLVDQGDLFGLQEQSDKGVL